MKKYEWKKPKNIAIPSMKNFTKAWWDNYWKKIDELKREDEKN